MLRELGELAMGLSRVYAASADAAAKAEAEILSEDWFTPEVGRARACGARDAAESFQKVSRAVRLTCKLEMTVAEIVRDIHAGLVTSIGGAHNQDADRSPEPRLEIPGACSTPERRRPAGSRPTERADADPRERDAERLVEFDRPEHLPRGRYADVVDGLAADLGVAVDWDRWTVDLSPSNSEPVAGIRSPRAEASRHPGAEARAECLSP